MGLSLTLRYASFRHKNKGAGRFVEFVVIALALAAIAMLLVTENIQIILASLCTLFFCLGSFWFFKNADQMRRAMPD
ncbi:hypothetical protein [Vibrio sp. 10N.286.48.B7]|uniref:hypothetical protein n=1 Tax=Vibrio sp. 10N.286.48.B7 TaxID=1880853 RepID=UPI000C83E900|nr:hypothetical protein [Vibrio sp. 10N.286.48.B7]PMH79011.1 hypothetical protein BCU58_06985 [Vibrio sp. 10N.286.48.B7]